MGRRFSTAEAVAMFRGEGRSITPQRMAVFGALERAEGHPTAEELHLRLRNSVLGLALKTVHLILHELASHRLIEPISVSIPHYLERPPEHTWRTPRWRRRPRTIWPWVRS
jgi:Fe2+ or Zn2+ uptake regulation protein